jgi:hypothetical protein
MVKLSNNRIRLAALGARMGKEIAPKIFSQCLSVFCGVFS